MTDRTLRTVSALCCCALVMLAHAPAAHAFKIPGCVKAPAAWNVPTGAVVANQSDGPIRAVLNGVNELLTHSIVAQADGWVTHATSLSPGTNDSCSNPVKAGELKNGHPGFSQTEVPGIYNFLRDSNVVMFHHWTNSPWDPAIHPWVHANNAFLMAAATDWLWNGVAFEWSPSKAHGLNRLVAMADVPAEDPGFYKLGFTSNGVFNWMPYNFHQYMQGTNRLFGGDPGFSPILNRALPNDAGIVCSQVPAYASMKASGNLIMAKRYSKQQTSNAGIALWYAVKDQCSNGIGFFKNLAAIAVTGCDRSAICSKAAWQVLNCFFLGNECNDTNNAPWNNWAADPTTLGAVSLSPDVLLGWTDNPTSGNGVSPWAAYQPSQVQWNGPGNTYRCWY